MKHNRVYLASASPRRRELLKQLAIDYQVIQPQVDETNHRNEPPETYTLNLAIAKALYVQDYIERNRLELHPVVAADTAVVLDNTIFGKPGDAEQAHDMLHTLSGRTHRVYSSLAVHFNGDTKTVVQVSDVKFRTLSGEEIKAYWQTGEPADKAGGYAIQGLGARFIRNLAGSYSGVMGLPLYELGQLLDTIDR